MDFVLNLKSGNLTVSTLKFMYNISGRFMSKSNLSYNKRRNIYNEQLQKISQIRFTFREIDVMACILHSRSEKKIASLLSINNRTVGTHVRNIMGKVGCNNKDFIIDFIEKSGKLFYLRQYYFHLIILFCFEKQLQKIKTLINRNIISCYFNVDKITDEESKLLQQLEQHLKLANILLTKDSKPSLYNLLIVGEEFPLKNEMDLERNIILLFDNKNDISFFQGIDHINFRFESDYYFSTFELIRQIICKDSLEKFIQEFKREYEAIQKSWHETGVANIDPIQDKKGHFLKNSKLLIAMSMIAICIVIYANNYTIQDNLATKQAIADLYNKLGVHYQNTAHDYMEAIKHYKSAEKVYIKLKSNINRAEMLVSQGWCHFAVRDLDRSLESFNQALKLLNDDIISIRADALSGKGIIYDKKRIDSLEFHQGAYKIYQKLYSTQDHPKTATALHNIGWYYRENKKDFREAMKYFEESLAMRKRLYQNQSHDDIASSLNNIGSLYAALGGRTNTDIALNYQEQALKMRKDLSNGQINQDIVNSYFRLGKTCMELEKYSKALDFFIKARVSTYEIYNTYNYGPIIEFFRNVAELCEVTGDIMEAIEYYKKAYSIIKRYKLSVIHPENKKVVEKIRTYASEFLISSETRLIIAKHGGVSQEVYDIKIKLRELLYKLHKQPGEDICMNNEQIKKILNKGSITAKELEVVKSLCFEAINIRLMSNTSEKRNFISMLKFAKKNLHLVQKISVEHPEYFVDGSIMIKCVTEGIISFDSMIKAIGELEYNEWLKSAENET